tara:strand:- start:3669 stop:3935 length:267 start_codon:yes stop_codon:yes gene_type:complete
MKTITIDLTDREYVELDLWAKQMRRKPKDQVEHMLSKRVGGARSNIRMDIITSTAYQSKALEKERLDFLNMRMKRKEQLARLKAQRGY